VEAAVVDQKSDVIVTGLALSCGMVGTLVVC
jgi:hypothetical protein